MAGIEEAAAVFQDAISGTSSKAAAPRSDEVSGKPEPLFMEPGYLENPEESAGGDDKPLVLRKKDLPADEDTDEDPDEENPDDEQDPEDKEEGDEEEDELLSREFQVMVGDEEVAVPLKTILDNYTDRETLSRHYSDLQETVATVRAEAERVAGLRSKAVEIYDDAIAVMKQIIPAEPDWDKLFQEDATKARALQKQYESFQKSVDEVVAKRNKAKADQQEAERGNEKEFAETEFTKFARSCKWANAKERDKDIASMRKTALSAGMTEEEISRLYDSRYLMILRKASKYDRMVANKPKPVVRNNGSKPNNSTTAPVRSGRGGMNQAQRRLSQTGSLHDAVPVFHEIIRRK